MNQLTAPGVDAIVLLAHGSRDAEWRQPIEAVAQRVAQRAPQLPVCCAYLELTEPDLPTAVNTLVQQGARHIRVLPLFLGLGKHARHDLPLLAAALRQQHPHITLELQPAAGEQARLLDLLATLALMPPSTPTAP